MSKCIDVFFSVANPRQPYMVLLFVAGRVINTSYHAHIADVAHYCRIHDPSAISSSIEIRDQLHHHGIRTQPLA